RRLARPSETKQTNLQVPGEGQRSLSLSDLLPRLAIIHVHVPRPAGITLAQRDHPEQDALFANFSSNP
ncbi:hypothetical protein A2U01_0072447, partial [Trifolium medium]|nr:hypothetical protein [Trifolium medium]